MISIFDVDKTVIKKSSAWYFLLEALEKKVISFPQIRQLPFEWLRYKLGFPNSDFIEETVKRIAGIEKTVLEELAGACFERRMKAGIFTGAAELIGKSQKRGEQVLFATSSLDILIRPLEHFFGVGESIASKLEFSQGKTTGRIAGGSFFGAKKKAAVQSWLEEHRLNPRDICFYSDSYTDIPLLEYCARAVAVNPDRFLEREAKKRGWEILRFRKTLNIGHLA
jgi:HAD superfamily hydrolase (TIGR01490 family)